MLVSVASDGKSVADRHRRRQLRERRADDQAAARQAADAAEHRRRQPVRARAPAVAGFAPPKSRVARRALPMTGHSACVAGRGGFGLIELMISMVDAERRHARASWPRSTRASLALQRSRRDRARPSVLADQQMELYRALHVRGDRARHDRASTATYDRDDVGLDRRRRVTWCAAPRPCSRAACFRRRRQCKPRSDDVARARTAARTAIDTYIYSRRRRRQPAARQARDRGRPQSSAAEAVARACAVHLRPVDRRVALKRAHDRCRYR